MFGKMGDLTSNYYLDKPSSEISPDLPAGMVTFREKWVKSAPDQLPGYSLANVSIKGRFDAIITFEDGSFGIIDYKTSDASRRKGCILQPAIISLRLCIGKPGTRGAIPIAHHTARPFHRHPKPL